MNSAAPTTAPLRFSMSPNALMAPRPQSVLTARKSARLTPSLSTYCSRPSASISEGGLMRKIHGLPRLVIEAALEVSTTIDAVLLELRHRGERHRAPPGAHDRGHPVADDELLGGARRLLRVGLVVLDHEVDLSAVDAAAGVEPVAGDLRAHPDVVAGRRDGPREGLDDADLDQRLRLRRPRRRGDRG